ncbi:DUF4214 domain-containing protein [Orrella daihaiensis]|uniref:DUF4214 domain-containing protein n=1 Tax=Orrella daihaiensis TaxID=2782176 RepID=A0ABY4AID0_9BURK|nr:DUF4214 domain-containing protein [Orrella daihaiensis]UOD49853.1 DUF4214 domain-containing protein [Orrella daihaiensis]
MTTSKVQFDLVAQNLSRTEGMVAEFLIDAGSPHRDTGYRAGDVLQYQISGLTLDDIDSASLSGTVTLDRNLQAIVGIPLKIDGVQEGEEILRLRVFDDQWSVTNQMKVLDGAWQTPVYRFDVVAQNLSVLEGRTASFVVNAQSPHHDVVYRPGDRLNYVISGVDASDLVFGNLSGFVVLDKNHEATISIPILADDQVEGAETLRITVSSPFYQASSQVPIEDLVTSEGPPESLSIQGSERVDILFAQTTRDKVQVTVDSEATWIREFDDAGNATDYQLIDIERLSFEDTSLALDINGTAGQAFRLYKAALDRLPEAEGLGYWIAKLDSVLSLTDAAAGFVSSAEFQATYGATVNDAAFIDLLYANVLDRAPDAEGFAYWQSKMADGMTREQVLIHFSESPENKLNVAQYVSQGIVYTPFLD